jgi:hypothetical protein
MQLKVSCICSVSMSPTRQLSNRQSPSPTCRLQALTCWIMLQACLESVGVDGVLLREWTQRDAGFLLPL